MKFFCGQNSRSLWLIIMMYNSRMIDISDVFQLKCVIRFGSITVRCSFDAVMAFLKRRGYKFHVDLELLNLSDVPLVNAVLFAKV